MLHKIWQKWKYVGEKIGNVTNKVFMTVFYFSIFAIPAVFLSFVLDKVGRKYDSNQSYFADAGKDLTLVDIERAKEM